MKELSSKLKKSIVWILTFSLAISTVSVTDYVKAAEFKETGVVIDATQYGADPSGKKDSAIAIWEAFEAAKKATEEGAKSVTVDFPKGEYHIYKDYAQVREYHTSNTNSIENPMKTIGILIEGQKNLTLEGNGSTFIMHGDIMALAVVKSENVTLNNFEWDYGVATVSEMTVQEIGVENGKSYTQYYIPSSYPFEIKNNKMVWLSEKSPYTGKYYWTKENIHNGWTSVYYDPSTKILRRTNPDYGNGSAVFDGKIEKIDENTVRIVSNGTRPGFLKPGVVVGFCATPVRTSAGAFIWESKDTVIDTVKIRYMHGFGFLTQMSENVTFRNCDFMPREGSGRYITSYADLIHVSGAKGTIDIENCDFSFGLDDPINIHGTFTRVEEKLNSKTLKLKYIENQQGGFPQYHKGDKIVFYSRQGLTPLNGVEKEYEVESFTNPFEDGNSGKEMTVTFTEDLPDNITDKIDASNPRYVAENITYTANVNIRNNRFATIPTRGILCTTRKPVLIENNTFETMAMQPIFMSNDSNLWYESGPARDVTIRNNTFYLKDSGLGDQDGIIRVKPEFYGGGMSSADVNNPVHQNLTIENNTFYMEKCSAINTDSVKNLKILNNKFYRLNPNIEIAIDADSTGLTVNQTQKLNVNSSGKQENVDIFKFNKCNQVLVEGNTYDDGLKLNIANLGSLNLDNRDQNKGLEIGAGKVQEPISNMKYASSNSTVVQVTKDGTVVGLKAGTADIFAYYEWNGTIIKSNAITFTVEGESEVTGSEIIIPEDDNQMISTIGGSLKFTVQEDAAIHTVTGPGVTLDETPVSWRVLDPATGTLSDKAEITSNGTLTAKKNGVVLVEASKNGNTAYKTVLISAPSNQTITINNENPSTWSTGNAGNSLLLDMEPGDIYGIGNGGGGGVKNLVQYDIPAAIPKDDMRTIVTVKGLPGKTGQPLTASFLLLKDIDNYVSVGKKGHMNGLTTVRENNGASVDEYPGETAQNNVTSASFALEKIGTTIKIYYKLDGGNWSEVKTISDSVLADDYKIGFAVWKPAGSTSDKVTFENFRVGKASEYTNDTLETVPSIVFSNSENTEMPVVSEATFLKAEYDLGEKASVNYTFADGDDDAEGSTIYRWGYTNTKGERKEEYTTTKEFTTKYPGDLDCTIYPVDDGGRAGNPVELSTTVTGTDSYALTELKINGTQISGFTPDVMNYTYSLLPGMSSLIVDFEAMDLGSTSVLVNGVEQGSLKPSDSIHLTIKDKDQITIVRKNTNGTAQATYTIDIKLAKDNTATLSSLEVSGLVETTTSVSPSIVVNADNAMKVTTIRATAAGRGTINLCAGQKKEVIATGNQVNQLVNLHSGLNSFYLQTTAEDGITKSEHMVHIIRSGYDDADAKSILIDGKEVGDFSPEKKEYTIKVPKGAKSADVSVELKSDKYQTAAVTVNGKRVEGNTSRVEFGDSKEIEVIFSIKADNSVTNQYYTINFRLPYDGNSNLESLDLENATLDRVFDKNILEYKSNINNNQIQISAKAEDEKATIAISANGTTKKNVGNITDALPLYKGKNTVNIHVTAPDSITTKLYTINVTVADKIYLSDLGWEANSTYRAGEFLEKDHSKFDNELIPLEITGDDGKTKVTYEKGIGTHAACDVIFKLNGEYKTFETYIGMAYNTRDIGAIYGIATFKVFLTKDGVETVHDYGEMKSDSKQQHISLDVSGVTQLRLVAENGNSPYADRVNWCDAKLIADAVTEAPKQYAVSMEKTQHGVITTDAKDNKVDRFGDVTFTFTPDASYKVKEVKVNGYKVEVTNENQYTVRNVQSDINVSAVFGLINESSGGSSDNAESDYDREISNAQAQINEAKSGSEVKIDLGTETKLPTKILNQAKERKVNLVIKQPTFELMIDGTSIQDISENIEEIDLGGISKIDKAVEKLAGKNQVKQLQLNYEGNYPFQGKIGLQVDKKYNGKNLFFNFYNEKDKTLEYTSFGEVGKNGECVFNLVKGGKFALMTSCGKVDVPVSKIKGTDKNAVTVGKKLQLKGSISPSKATIPNITWKSSNSKYAQVDKQGVVTPKKAGLGKTITIKAAALDGKGAEKEYRVYIGTPAKTVTITTKNQSVTAGTKIKLDHKIGPKTSTNQGVKWTVSNSKYATVTSNGTVMTKKAGKGKIVTIKATAKDGQGASKVIKIKIK